MTSLRTFIETRRREIQAEIAALKLELQELKLAEAAIRTGVVGAGPQPGIDGRPTIKEMILHVLQERPEGADAIEIIQFIRQEFGEDIARSSLSPQLSRLKEDSKVSLEGRTWKLAEYIEDPGSHEPEPSMKNGGGKVQAPDFPIASPEGASPSTSTADHLRGFTRTFDDDIPF